MKSLCLTTASLSIACILILAPVPRAMSQGPAANAKTLLAEAKKKQSERKRSAMQKELDRLAEDVKKGQQEMEELEASMSKVGYAVSETKGQMDQLAGRKKRVTQDMELLPLRIDAEKLKADALTLLNSAHTKAAEALKRRNEELDLKAALVTSQIHKLEDAEVGSEPGTGKSDSGPTLTELSKNLQKASEKSALANLRAREAMEAASEKLLQAEAATMKAEKKQAQIEQENAPAAPAAPAAESVKPKAKNAR